MQLVRLNAKRDSQVLLSSPLTLERNFEDFGTTELVLSTSVFVRRNQLQVKGVFKIKQPIAGLKVTQKSCSFKPCRPGRFLGLIGQNLSVSKSNRLHVVIFRFFFTHLRYIP